MSLCSFRPHIIKQDQEEFETTSASMQYNISILDSAHN